MADLYELNNQGHIDLYFGHEAGFSLNLNVPYGWLFADEPIRILPQRGKQVNVLGFLKSTGDQVHTFSKEGSVKAEFVIESINSWPTSLCKPTVLVLDNALNRIERLWLKAKQRWLKPADYSDWGTLTSALAEIWANFGDK